MFDNDLTCHARIFSSHATLTCQLSYINYVFDNSSGIIILIICVKLWLFECIGAASDLAERSLHCQSYQLLKPRTWQNEAFIASLANCCSLGLGRTTPSLPVLPIVAAADLAERSLHCQSYQLLQPWPWLNDAFIASFTNCCTRGLGWTTPSLPVSPIDWLICTTDIGSASTDYKQKHAACLHVWSR